MRPPDSAGDGLERHCLRPLVQQDLPCGFEPQPLNYEYLLIKGKRVAEHNPLNPKYRLFIKLWQRLPLPVATALGPWLAKDLG